MFAGISWGEKRRERQAEADTHRWPSLTNCVPYLEHCIPTWMHDPPEDYISQPPLQLGIWPGYQVPAKGIWTKVTRTTSWSCPQQESSWGSSGREFSSTPVPPHPPLFWRKNIRPKLERPYGIPVWKSCIKDSRETWALMTAAVSPALHI